MNNLNYLENFVALSYYRILKEQTIENFALENNLSVNKLIFENPKLKKGDIVIYNNTLLSLHIVLPLETLESIARAHSTTVDEIKKNNNITKLFIGQQIFV